MINTNIYVKDIKDVLKYKVLNNDISLDKKILNPHILVPGLELTGVNDESNKNKIIVLGNKEANFLNNTSYKVLSTIINNDTPCIILSELASLNKEAVQEVANKVNVPVLLSNKESDEILIELYSYLSPLFAPSELVHGTLVSVYGMGVLLTGESGIGKSEIGLQLVKNGHRLVADDSVVTYVLANKLYGRGVEHQKNILEVRGLGLVNVFKLFGVNAVLDSIPIDLVINLVPAEETYTIDRLIDPLFKVNINNNQVSSIKLPLNKARNIVDIIEIAVMDYRNRQMGYSATLEYIKKHDKLARGEE